MNIKDVCFFGSHLHQGQKSAFLSCESTNATIPSWFISMSYVDLITRGLQFCFSFSVTVREDTDEINQTIRPDFLYSM